MQKSSKLLKTVSALIITLLIASCSPKTPGQKLDKAIDSVHHAAQKTEKKYEDKKETVQKKSDQAREDLANKIKPH